MMPFDLEVFFQESGKVYGFFKGFVKSEVAITGDGIVIKGNGQVGFISQSL